MLVCQLVMTKYKDVNPLSPDYKRPQPVMVDLARRTEAAGTGLDDPSGILARVVHGDGGYEDTRKLTNREAFAAAAHMIKGAGIEVSYRQAELGGELTVANTLEIEAAKRQGRQSNPVGAVVLRGATQEQLNDALMDLYSQSEQGSNPPSVHL